MTDRSEPNTHVTDADVAILRASIEGRADEILASHSRHSRLNGSLGGFVPLTWAAFVLAARRQFAPMWSRSEVIQFVGMIRAVPGGQPDLLDPLAAETELRVALGEDLPPWPDPQARVAAEVMLLGALVAALELDDAGVDDLLGEARALVG